MVYNPADARPIHDLYYLLLGAIFVVPGMMTANLIPVFNTGLLNNI